VLASEITHGTDIPTANAMGLAVTEYKPKSQQAAQYKALTKEIEKRLVKRTKKQLMEAEA
jgi:nitrogenase subunit NifH